MSQPSQQEVIMAEDEASRISAAAGIEPIIEAKGLSQGQIVRKRFLGHSGAIIGLVVFSLIFILAFTSVGYLGIPGWWKYNHEQVSPLVNGGAPTSSLWPLAWGEHPFGQDRIGRDVFAMTMRGAQQSITIMIVIGVIAGLIGVVVGAISGYFRGWPEAILMRLTDVIIIIPALLLAAVMAALAGRRDQGSWFASFASTNGVLALGIFLGLISWVALARLMRGEFLSLREREFVDAARISGASNARIIFKHILPNAVGVLIVNVTLTMSAAILLETALSYLGVGVKSPDTSLGLLISQNQQAFTTRPWLFWFPGMFIVLICLSINFIGDGLRDAFDPRQKKFNAKKAADHGGPAVQASAVTGLDGPEQEGFRQAGFRPEGPGHDGPADGTRGQ